MDNYIRNVFTVLAHIFHCTSAYTDYAFDNSET
jgi:hypothetical protein